MEQPKITFDNVTIKRQRFLEFPPRGIVEVTFRGRNQKCCRAFQIDVVEELLAQPFVALLALLVAFDDSGAERWRQLLVAEDRSAFSCCGIHTYLLLRVSMSAYALAQDVLV